MNFQPWKAIEILDILSVQLKQQPIDQKTVKIAANTAKYEQTLRDLWSDFKENPTEENAVQLTLFIKENSKELWMQSLLDILNIDLDELTPKHREFFDKQLQEHHSYVDNSLLPDIITGIRSGQTDFSNMDYRTIFLYAGALWSFGFLATVMFDGLDIRDLADLFIFVGPDDENTCTGPRGCKQHVGKIYTVFQILNDNIIPGKLRCLTSCRHMLIPVASPL